MIPRTSLLLIAAVIAGLFWSLGSMVHAVVTHFIAPLVFAMIVAALWHQFSLRRQLHMLLLSLGVAEVIRLIVYCVQADGWQYISGDAETQCAIAFSFGLQLIIGIAALCVARFFFRQHETRTA